MPYFELSKDEITFPPPYFADNEGMLAVGGDMSIERLLLAYNSGIFYWHFPLKHIKWWSPDPRTVIVLDTLDFPEDRFLSLKETYKVTYNTDFEKVLRLCQQVYNIKDRMTNEWLSERSFRAFLELHKKGFAHSVEIWKDNRMVGGAFGVAIGTLFFGEYKFEIKDHAAELALLSLLKKLSDEQFRLIDMQKPTIFLDGLEYDELSRIEYVGICKANAEQYPSHIREY